MLRLFRSLNLSVPGIRSCPRLQVMSFHPRFFHGSSIGNAENHAVIMEKDP